MKKAIVCFVLTCSFFYASQAQEKDFLVGGYVPSWKDCSATDYSPYTHLFFSFAMANADGSFLPFTPDQQQHLDQFKEQAKGKKRLLSIGGGNDITLPVMAASDSARNKFADACVQFCKENDFQGIDMDWENIRDNENASHFEALLKILSEKLHANNLLLVSTIAFGWGGDFYTFRALKYADWIQLMVYDQTGAWEASPYGNHSSFQHMLDAVDYWKRKGYTKSAQIVIGLPFYGYKFKSDAGGIGTQLAYNDIATYFPFLGKEINEHNLIVFNGPELITEKTAYAKRKGFKGVMVWEVTQDLPLDNDKSLLKAIVEGTK